MTRSIRLLASAALIALLGIAALPASAGEMPSPDPVNCDDADAKAAADLKREAALAELGRRLAAEPQDDGEVRVLNRTGHNYGSSREVQVQQLPAPPPAKQP